VSGARVNARHETRRTVAVDCFARDFQGFRRGYAVVAVDVIRASTMALTAVILGRRCFPAATLDSAVNLAQRLEQPLLAGELGGNVPYGFDLDNSPVALRERYHTARPLVLLSTSGTQLIREAAQGTPAVYVACLRNVSAQAAYVIDRHPRVAIVGAGSRGEFREEDQLCCSRIAELLVRAGYEPEGDTSTLIERWRGASVSDVLVSNSVRFLRTTGRARDLDFILQHVDDVQAVLQLAGDELVLRASNAT
jgi:2-phosphosulfolactate phosphatase